MIEVQEVIFRDFVYGFGEEVTQQLIYGRPIAKAVLEGQTVLIFGLSENKQVTRAVYFPVETDAEIAVEPGPDGFDLFRALVEANFEFPDHETIQLAVEAMRIRLTHEREEAALMEAAEQHHTALQEMAKRIYFTAGVQIRNSNVEVEVVGGGLSITINAQSLAEAEFAEKYAPTASVSATVIRVRGDGTQVTHVGEHEAPPEVAQAIGDMLREALDLRRQGA